MLRKLTPSRLVILIIGGLFISELFSMGTIALIKSLTYLQLSIIDSFLLIFLATPLLYFFSLRPLLNVISEREAEINRRYQVEVQLRVQTKALETAANGVVITDKDGIIIWANQAFAQMSGYLIEDILGKKTSLLKSGAQSQDFYKNLWDTILAGFVWYGEITNRKKNGSNFISELTISPVLNASGGIENFIAINQDITERKQAEIALRGSEEKFRNLLDWTFDWEMWMDGQDKVMYNSPSSERITGYHPGDFVANPELLMEIVHPDDQEIFKRHLIRSHDASVGAINIEYRIIAHDGNEHWISHNCRPLFGADSRYLGRRVSNRDVTEQKLAEEEISERFLKEKILTETIHSMQINIARDLHDTVGQNISYLRMKLDFLSGEYPHTDEEIKTEIRSMGKVANESYDLMRGTLAVLQTENIADLFRFFTRYAAQVEERSQIKINIKSDGESKLLTSSQMRQLFYIYREALSNIEKHAGATQVFIKLFWNESSLTLELVDNGCGIAAGKLKAENHYGLKFMRERAELMNGLISIQSEVGAGTNITISVPYE